LKIDCYLSHTCGAGDELREKIFEALAGEGLQAEVRFHRIDEKEAASLGLRGSPSVLINGEDIQPIDVTGFS
jgi:hypothetical protein